VVPGQMNYSGEFMADCRSLDPQLSATEVAVLRMIAEGSSSRSIATCLNMGPRDVERHIHQLCAKLGARNRTHLVALACGNGLIGGTPAGFGKTRT
jgi:DNA-binding CsgD family transcriptional regulator